MILLEEPFNLRFNDDVAIKLITADGSELFDENDDLALQYDKPKHVVNSFTFGNPNEESDAMWTDDFRTPLEASLNPLR